MNYDFVIIGAGMTGASIAAELAPSGTVLILEAEEMPGYHATGRSAAFWSETYGGLLIQPLTSASHDFLVKPPSGFSESSFLNRRGALHIAKNSGYSALETFTRDFDRSDVVLDPLSNSTLSDHCPGLRKDWDRAIWEPSCADIDVDRLHQAYLRAAKRSGAELRCSAPVSAIENHKTGWRIRAGDEWIVSGIVVNAAGAWADTIAELAGISRIGVVPYRRTVVQLRTAPAAPESLPLVIDAEGTFYFKGEGPGRIWLSPHDETLVQPGDTAPEEIDVAHAIDRFEKAVDWEVLAVERKWAGLRSFSLDRLPIYGFDPRAAGFFWCAGQGGVGIQTAPAAAILSRSLILGESLPSEMATVNAQRYTPDRFI